MLKRVQPIKRRKTVQNRLRITQLEARDMKKKKEKKLPYKLLQLVR